MVYLCGFLMALADSVPGVSGGTIAFLLGLYDEFMNSLESLVSGNISEKKKALLFLAKLGVAWIIGMILAVLLLTSIFENHIYEISSVFIGFILFSIPLVIKEEIVEFKGKYLNFIYLLIGVILVISITFFSASLESSSDVLELSFGMSIYIFVAGMIAISAMVLPGISGSTLLLIFGLYMPVLNAIKDFLHFDFNGFYILVLFGLGVVTGICLVIKGINIALKKFRSQTMYMIIGLMLGSIYSIIEGPKSLEIPKSPMNFSNFNILFFILGGIIILGLQLLKFKNSKK